jgi:hypothetical protein
MPDDPFTLRQIGQTRTDFAIIEDELEALHARLALKPTRSGLARAALSIIFCTAIVTTLLWWWLLRP